MGGICSSCTTAGSSQIPQSIEENIFDILPRNSDAPEDLFKPLDLHFARNNTLSNLLSLYPSRRLPAALVSTIWQHYFEYWLIDSPSSVAPLVPLALTSTMTTSSDLLQDHLLQSPHRSSSLNDSSILSASSIHRTHALAPLSPRSPTIDGIASSHSTLNATGATVGKAPLSSTEVEDSTTTEINCMQWVVTDILRHDLACLKERYDEVLATSLSMPHHSGNDSASPGAFIFNPQPVLKSIRGELQRLNNMPIDYLARAVLKEMKGVNEEDELSTNEPPLPNKSSQPTNPIVPLNSVLSPTARGPSTDHQRRPSIIINKPTFIDATLTDHPIDKPIPPLPSTSNPIASPRPLPALSTPVTSARSRPQPRLTYERFAAHIDCAFKNLFDRYYRKGYWVLFSLNLVHNARKVEARFSSLSSSHLHPARLQPSSSLSTLRSFRVSSSLQPFPPSNSSSHPSPTTVGSSDVWSERIMNALAANEMEVAHTIKPRKSSHSLSGAGPGTPAATLATMSSQTNGVNGNADSFNAKNNSSFLLSSTSPMPSLTRPLSVTHINPPSHSTYQSPSPPSPKTHGLLAPINFVDKRSHRPSQSRSNLEPILEPNTDVPVMNTKLSVSLAPTSPLTSTPTPNQMPMSPPMSPSSKLSHMHPSNSMTLPQSPDRNGATLGLMSTKYKLPPLSPSPSASTTAPPPSVPPVLPPPSPSAVSALPALSPSAMAHFSLQTNDSLMASKGSATVPTLTDPPSLSPSPPPSASVSTPDSTTSTLSASPISSTSTTLISPISPPINHTIPLRARPSPRIHRMVSRNSSS